MGLNDSTCVLFPFLILNLIFLFLSFFEGMYTKWPVHFSCAGRRENQLARPHYYYTTTHVKGGGFCCCCAGLQLSLLKFSFDDDDDLGLIRTRVPTTATTIPTGRPILAELLLRPTLRSTLRRFVPTIVYADCVAS
jgi:hypothetical protein